MRIVIEEPMHGWGRGGVSVYIRNLVRELLTLDTENEYAVFGYFFRSYHQKRGRISLPDNDRLRLLLPQWPESVINRLEWGAKFPIIESYLSLHGTDVYHAHRIPQYHWLKTVTTIHDLFPVIHPEWGTPYLDDLYKKIIRPGLQRVDRVIAISERTKMDIIERWGVPSERIEVILSGVNHEIFKPIQRQATADAQSRYKLPEFFLLMIGPFDPWSDPRNSIRALASLPKALSDVALVMIGHAGSCENEAKRLANELGVSERIHWIGFVPRPDLVAIYNLALALLYPSFYEGFGLPVLESMSCGTPVITSNVASLPEVAGDAAIQVDPTSVEQLTDAIQRIVDDAPLRSYLREKGLRRAAEFSWAKTAKKTLDIYKSVARR